MTTVLLAFFAVMGVAAGAALAYLLVQDFRDVARRGEVAEAPDLPRTKGCPLNATPHFCCDPAEPLPDVPFGTGEQLARELTDYLKGNR